MKTVTRLVSALTACAVLSLGLPATIVLAADAKEDVIKDVMQKFHKAPRGTDPTCKKASDGKATPEELQKLVAAYKTLTTAKPPKGDDASWKEKAGKLYAAAQALEKGAADGAARFKDAVNCKACHSVHKPN